MPDASKPRAELYETWPFFAMVTLFVGAGYVLTLRSATPPQGPRLLLFTVLVLATVALHWLSPFLIATRSRLWLYCLVQAAAAFAIGLLTSHHWLMLALYGALIGIVTAAFWPDWRTGALERAGGELRLTAEDNGTGFDPGATTTGFGLAGMRERAARAGGELRVDSGTGRGTTVELVVPEVPP